MPYFLTIESLATTAAEYRKQQAAFYAAGDLAGSIRADGAAIAVEHLIRVAFPQMQIVIEEPAEDCKCAIG